MSSSHTLYKLVLASAMQGYVCIPLKGVGHDAKAPHPMLKSWRAYQKQQPGLEDYQNWFVSPVVQAYGIITGKVSGGIFVIDFDNAAMYGQFCKQFPEMAETYTVSTRRGYHAYLRTDALVKSGRIQGGDLQGEGRYVVGVGSRIKVSQHQNYCYQVARAGEVCEIAIKDYEKLRQWLNVDLEQVSQVAGTKVSEDSLKKQYVEQVQELGRNNALYTIAREASVNGVQQETTVAALAQLHVVSPSIAPHPKESPAQRYREAMTTIASAYKGTSAQKRHLAPLNAEKGHLPNALREALLQSTGRQNSAGEIVNGSSVPGRLLEALYQEGYAGGEIITETQFKAIGKQYHVGEKSVQAVLNGKYAYTSAGHRIFHKYTREGNSYSQSISKTPAGDSEKTTLNENYRSKIEQFLAENYKRGRKPCQFYRIPKVDELCLMYGVYAQAADVLSAEDLMSARAYKQALHREYIRRTDCIQSRSYLAMRLGCHPRTIDSYDRQLGVVKVAVIEYSILDWNLVFDPQLYGQLRSDGITPGRWLERQDGKRFPAIMGIALSQLAAGEKLIICRQRPTRRMLTKGDSIGTENTTLWRAVTHLNEHNEAIQNRSRSQPYKPRIKEKQIAQEKLDDKQVPRIQERIDCELTLIKGIKARRAARLKQVGIERLSELVEMGAERLARLYWPGAYVSEHTTRGWVEQAEILLGWRSPDPQQLADQERRRIWQLHKGQYRRLFKRSLKYLETITVWEAQLQGFRNPAPGKLRHIIADFQEQLTSHNEDFYAPQQVKRMRSRILRALEQYHKRIERFLGQDETWLARWYLGTHKIWRKLAREVQALLSHWHECPLYAAKMP